MAGIFGSVLSFVGGPIGGGVGSVLDSIIGGGSTEDKSVTGFQNFISTRPAVGVAYPTVTELVRVGTAAGWPADDLAAIRSTYNQSNGTFRKGDWNGVVVSTSPTQVKWFKGASESFIRQAEASNVAFANTSANNIAEAPSQGASQAQKAAFGGGAQVNSQGASQPGTGVTSIPWMMIGGVIAVILAVVAFFSRRKR
jgi:LPXTG-motif cell wall-anchored protein